MSLTLLTSCLKYAHLSLLVCAWETKKKQKEHIFYYIIPAKHHSTAWLTPLTVLLRPWHQTLTWKNKNSNIFHSRKLMTFSNSGWYSLRQACVYSSQAITSVGARDAQKEADLVDFTSGGCIMLWEIHKFAMETQFALKVMDFSSGLRMTMSQQS